MREGTVGTTGRLKLAKLCGRYQQYGISLLCGLFGATMGNSANRHRMRKSALLLRATLSGLMLMSGCSRPFYRNRADKDVTHVLTQKDQYPDWKIEQYHVYPDPRARFADPTNPDRPPMPPDDPAASKLSPHPQIPGKAGVTKVEGSGYLELLTAWDTENRAEAASDAQEKAGSVTGEQRPDAPGGKTDEKSADNKGSSYTSTSLVTEPKPGKPRPYLLKLEQAVELGVINSREYQDAREDLYLTALPVTRQRFAFAPQVFAAGQAIREWAGSQTPDGPFNGWKLNSNLGVAELFSTGALLLMNFANQTIVNLTGAAQSLTSQSTINLNLIQPLLQGGGLAVTLEPLTQVERNLLYQIRAFARFRKTFFVAIAGGGGGSITGAQFQPTNVIAANAFSPTAGFATSGIIPGVIPPIPIIGNPGLQVDPGSSGRINLQTALNAPVSGYLSTLQEAAQIQVDKYNIEKLDGFFKLAQSLKEGGDLSQLQVDQFEQQLLAGRRNLLNDQQDYLQTIDQFKLQLGIPPCFNIELDDSPFRPLNRQFQRYEDLFRAYKAASDEPLRYGTPDKVAEVRGMLRRIFTSSELVRGTRFRSEIESRWRVWEKRSDRELDKRLAAYKEERRRLLDRQTDLETKGQKLSAADQQRLDTVQFEIELGEFEKALRLYESQPWKKLPDPEARRRRQQSAYGDVVPAFIIVLTQARNERMQQLHEQWPKLKRLCVQGVDLLKVDLEEGETAASQYALVHRLDLMNVRAQLVDAWRQLAVFANALLGVFNVQYHLDSNTPAELARPFGFSGSRTRQELILNTQLPLVRIEERNNYRASLINYQRARRILQRAEDQVMYDVRQELIQLRQQEELYLIQARQVELAYMTVENSLDTLQAPLAPSPAGQGATDTSTRAAALTNQLINAQNSLYNAQFTMTSIWITYLNTRLQLYRDMELMPLDERGVWIDNVETCECPPEEKSAESAEKTPADGEKLPAPRPVHLPEAQTPE